MQEDLEGCILPPTLSLSSENVEQDGIYLLENGEDAFLFVNSQASGEVLYQIFRTELWDELVVGQVRYLCCTGCNEFFIFVFIFKTNH